MAEHVAETTEAAPAGPSKDPIVQGSLLWPIFLSLIALLLSTAWALYDEGYTRKQYKKYQTEWKEVARTAYSSKLQAARADYERVVNDPEYKQLVAAYEASRKQSEPRAQELSDKLNKEVNPRLAVLAWPVKVARSQVSALTYRLEHSRADKHDEEARRYESELKVVRDERHSLKFPGEDAAVSWDFAQMDEEFTRLKALQGKIQGEMAAVNKPTDEARAKMNAWREAHLRGASPDSIAKLVDSMDTFIDEIKQIHIQGKEGGELIERCESCHLGTRSPVELTLADVGGKKAFTSHPDPELLKIHDPERFGCTPCHGGNGIAVADIEKGHGRYHHWLWPMWFEENTESGCVHCHKDDIRLDHADTFNRGKQLFYQRGCWGCHRYEGFGREADEQKLLEKNLDSAVKRIGATELDLARLETVSQDTSLANEVIEKTFKDMERRKQDLHLQRTERREAEVALGALALEVKRVGPNLKEIRAKLHPEWIHPWLMDPRAFRPDTKMPRFRLDDERAWNVAAFLWQSSDPATVAKSEEGDAEKGQTLVISRGCLGCHSVSTDDFDTIGKGWAANLSRLGEKAEFDYIASWVKNPRHHNPYTVMPSLRLSDEDARDIAAWLMTKKDEGAKYGERAEALAKLEDRARFKEGEKLVRHLGCAGCHEIKGLENEGRVGTELTEEGSKPLERLDFGTFTHEFKHRKDARHPERHGQYDHKGFFEQKIHDPAFFYRDKHVPNWFDQLKMPSFYTRPGEPGYEERRSHDDKDIDALVTFVLGSVEAKTGVPDLHYKPTDWRKDIQQGWWLVKKYNCDGCHQIVPGEKPAIWELPIYQDGAGFENVPDKNGRPPTLVGEGSRVDPVWLSKFLANPALTEDPAAIHRNGVRQGMMVRMPTFFLSERERGTLVRFFVALSRLGTNYVRPDVKPLVGEELELARAAFTSGDCANCHTLGGEATINPQTTYAPSFQPVAQRIRPEWIHPWVTQPSTVIPGTAMPAILSKVPTADGGSRWIIDPSKVSGAAKARIGDAMLARLAAYQGDFADLLTRYFALWNETEAEHQKAMRAK